ncbi:MBL fold metallo-hydrolase [Actinoplanes sp. Pm04-4]|uniref:MBL fold metallo-hydrolase n=1 Tax=Paractinoplanes pyxinae TaxID=2997416 RepID=A0ABT4ARR7_9ACTN|nr:MBL fold metallo-hydrolase [Actinoplanes pyxinae]MCY1136921.1 MBL fold metallo-hydrolase [Actinoplanes pyxinae]
MCDTSGGHGPVSAAMPRAAEGPAADPITLPPVDEVTITTLVDNVFDALLGSDDRVTRAPFGAGTATAPQFEDGLTTVGLRAEHGFSALVTVRRGDDTTTLLFDTGLSPDAMVVNADRLGLDVGGLQAVVLSHGHFDHAGGLIGLSRQRGARGLPMVIHPGSWARRKLATQELPTLTSGPSRARASR